MPNLGKSATLSIHLDDTTLFVRPSPAPEVVPSNDPIFRGVVVLSLPRPKRIKSVTVKLVRYYNISFPEDYAYEAGATTEAEVAICSSKEERSFGKGQHTFAFTLVVPASIATYERSQYGRIYHKIQACAKGDGLMEPDVTREREIHIVGNPSDEGEMQDFNLRIENHLDDIGPYAITMASQHLTVGGLMQFDVLLAGPPTPLLIRSLSAFIIAKYHLSSIQNPKKTPQTVEHKRRIFLVDYSNPPDRHAIHDAEGNKRILHSHDGLNQTHSNAPSTSSPVTPQGPSSVPSVPPRTPVPRRRFSERDTSVPSHCVRHDQRRSTIPPVAVTKLSPLHALPSATSYHISHLARLPSDEFIRPSTLKGTNTPIEISHDIVLELKFEHPESENDVKVLKVSKSLTISSCCCMIESLLVPTYSETDSIPSTPLPASPVDASPTMSLRSFAPRWQDNCVCERPTDWLIATQKLLGGGKTEEWEVRGMGGCPNAREKAEYQQVTEHNDV